MWSIMALLHLNFLRKYPAKSEWALKFGENGVYRASLNMLEGDYLFLMNITSLILCTVTDSMLLPLPFVCSADPSYMTRRAIVEAAVCLFEFFHLHLELFWWSDYFILYCRCVISVVQIACFKCIYCFGIGHWLLNDAFQVTMDYTCSLRQNSCRLAVFLIFLYTVYCDYME